MSTAEGDSFVYPAYATDHPTGTGPFKFQAYDKANNTVTLVRNEDYWGEKAKSKTLIFKIIPDETARKQELQAGTIDGYDLPEPGRLGRADRQPASTSPGPTRVQHPLPGDQRRSTNPALSGSCRVRQALAYALNRQQFVRFPAPRRCQRRAAVLSGDCQPDTPKASQTVRL